MKLIVVTPAGRERYMRLLAHYVLGSEAVDGWQLWDNCRKESDRAYLEQLAASDPRCTIKHIDGADGGIKHIGDFFRFCDDKDAIYLRLDDDVVFIESGFFARFKERMLANRGTALWFAPMIINNAICSSMLQHLSSVEIRGRITTQAMCPYSWAYPEFPEAMHPVLIDAVRRNRLDDFRTPDREVRMARFSVNAIAFFGSEIVELGERFTPRGIEEEWLSAVLPAKLNRSGMVLGDLIVSHFSFHPQERRLLQTGILDAYYELAGLPPPQYYKPRDGLKQWMRRLAARLDRTRPHYTIRLRDEAGA